jgi:hypothetical protein
MRRIDVAKDFPRKPQKSFGSSFAYLPQADKEARI